MRRNTKIVGIVLLLALAGIVGCALMQRDNDPEPQSKARKISKETGNRKKQRKKIQKIAEQSE